LETDMTYTPKFWTGHREADVARAFDLDTPNARDFKAAARAYYRLFNDGAVPHHATFTRLCKAANMTRRVSQRDEAETQDDLVEALLDRALTDA
jgi:hypothetical protein